MYLSVVVPAYNEENNINSTINKFISYLDASGYDYEIIIVNDGSSDRTREACLLIADKNKRIKFIDNNINMGKGHAVREGLKRASGDYILFIDADNATSIDHLEKAKDFLNQGYDFIIGSRSPHDAKGAYQRITQAYWKRLFGLYGNYIIRKIINETIRDTQCGFKILKKDFARLIVPKLMVNRWGFDVEMIVLARLYNARVGIIPVVWNNSPKSRVSIKGYFATLKDIFKIKINMLNKKYE